MTSCPIWVHFGGLWAVEFEVRHCGPFLYLVNKCVVLTVDDLPRLVALFVVEYDDRRIVGAIVGLIIERISGVMINGVRNDEGVMDFGRVAREGLEKECMIDFVFENNGD
ncbi:hypothetical protein ACJJTC_005395 [Scirpophaga incertulas]